jgi:hypothetical protein
MIEYISAFVHNVIQDIASTDPKVVWEDFTYPNVACLGGILAIDWTQSRRLDVLIAVPSSRGKATIVLLRGRDSIVCVMSLQ